jgi:hypothetical protein
MAGLKGRSRPSSTGYARPLPPSHQARKCARAVHVSTEAAQGIVTGLDPAIHFSSKMMDARIKSAHDEREIH